MCGKFTQMASWREIVAFSQPMTALAREADIIVSTPMRFANIVKLNATGAREIVPMRWGFAGKTDTAPSRPKHMHARCETVDTKPTFKQPFAHGRGILFVRTFNEGEELPNGKTRQWVITPSDAKPIAIAVISEEWRNGAGSLQTFVQVTTPANLLISRITDRMPATLNEEDVAIWLGESSAAPSELKALLRTFDDGGNWNMAEQVASRTPKPRSVPSQHRLL